MTQRQVRGPALGVDAPRADCTRCGAAVPWRVVKFCMERRQRFRGRVYCVGCQSGFPPP